jgi:thymidine kinase
MFPEDSSDNIKRKGWIEIITGSMFSGKTEELIRRLKRAQLANQNVEIFKPKIDKSFSTHKIISHDDKSIISKPVKIAANILKLVTDAEVIGIDEAQFFDDGLVDVCNDLANSGLRIIVAGLDMDFKGLPFGPIPELMACAEYITKLHAICLRCGSLAQYSHRKSDTERLILLGEQDEYEPLCRKCYLAAKSNK